MSDKKLGPSEVDEATFSSAVFEEGGALLVNLAGVEEMKFELIPKGIYDAEVDEVTFGQSRSSGNNMFTFIFRIIGGDYDGRKLYFYASFSPKALRGTKTNLIRLDPVIFGGQFNPQELVDSGVLLGKKSKIRVTIGQRQDTGEDQSQIAGLMPAGDAASQTGSSGGGFFQ